MNLKDVLKKKRIVSIFVSIMAVVLVADERVMHLHL
jgi:hypothetical protein